MLTAASSRYVVARSSAALVVASLVAACGRDRVVPAPALSASAGGATAPTSSGRLLGRPSLSRLAPPSGPAMLIEADKGVGPIRIGATVATIERLMAAKCEILTAERCRFVDRAVDFLLTDGITREIVVQRPGRDAGNGRHFGFFNGFMLPDLRPGMTPEAIQEHLGKPDRVEPVAVPGPDDTVERHHYPGMVLEYDRPEPPKLALGGIHIVRRAGAPAGGASSASSAAGMKAQRQ
jgi:hypothetical protein